MADSGFAIFTKEMKKTHTILIPQMLPIHFALLREALLLDGYKVEILEDHDRYFIEEGLKYVHNDMCYPAILVIGQFINALKSGLYDTTKVALIITQTGGGCRASNYIHLLRKALVSAGFAHVPVIALAAGGLETKDEFEYSKSFIGRAVYALLYGDLLMTLYNQTRSRELVPDSAKRKLEKWIKILSIYYKKTAYLRFKHHCIRIVEDFATIPLSDAPLPKVGIVGEIYLKYSALGNNYLEDFLIAENAEPVLSGVLDFVLYSLSTNETNRSMYGIKKDKKGVTFSLKKLLMGQQNIMIKAIENHSNFTPMDSFEELYNAADHIISKGVVMGEGWLLTAEILVYLRHGINNVVCAQPFGCLPNHIVAKGVFRAIKNEYPDANLVAIDYDASASSTNQENRLKLLLATAKNLQSCQEHKILAPIL